MTHYKRRLSDPPLNLMMDLTSLKVASHPPHLTLAFPLFQSLLFHHLLLLSNALCSLYLLLLLKFIYTKLHLSWLVDRSQCEIASRPKKFCRLQLSYLQMQRNIIGYSVQGLEQEVHELKKMLENEEKVHEILERALLPKAHISNVLPKKTKELLAELVMVEEEINRLENEINKIHIQSKTKEVYTNKYTNKSFEVKPTKEASRSISCLDELLLPPNYTKVALQTKPLFFINQAMNGEYKNGFTSVEKKENMSIMITNKEKPDNLRNQESAPRKSMDKAALLKPPRHSMQKTHEHEKEMLYEALKEPPEDGRMKKDEQTLPPNKLSEKIMKWMICIFSRLTRTHRSSELEKLGSHTRTTFSSFKLMSNRGENVLNLSPRAVKETGQQDPYGIFEIKDSMVRDIGPYKNLIMCTSSSFDTKNISKSLHLLTKLRGLMNNLRDVDLQFLTHNERLAFWINTYNICIMHGFLQFGLPSNLEKIAAIKKKAMVNISSTKLNAKAIEDSILRLPSKKEAEKIDAVRSLYGLEKSEPNTVFALCCGNKSSPSVKIYTAEGVSAELEKSKLEYLQASIVVTSAKRIMIPKLLSSNIDEFANDTASLIEWICNQLPASGTLRKSMADCLKAHSNKESSDFVNVIPYDFSFQYLLPM